MPQPDFTSAQSDKTTEITVYIGDDPYRYPPDDCGHSVSLHIVRFMADDRDDQCTIGWMPRDEFARRVAERMSRCGVRIEFPNGITTEQFQRLEGTPRYAEAAKAVLSEFARARGLEVPPMVFLGTFPFDAFIGP